MEWARERCVSEAGAAGQDLPGLRASVQPQEVRRAARGPGAYELRKHCSRRCLGIASSREQRSGRADLAARSAGPYQLPVVDLAGGARPGRLWRKVVLPVGRVRHGGRILDFGRETLESIAANFRARAFDAVPLVVATPDNRHTEDPTRYAGKVREMSVTDRGSRSLPS